MDKKTQKMNLLYSIDKQHIITQCVKKLCACSIIYSLLFPTHVLAVPLTSIADINANSTIIAVVSPNDTYQLNLGNHTVPDSNAGLINLGPNVIKNILMIAGTTLDIGSVAGTSPTNRLHVDNFTVNDGTLNSWGGAGAANLNVGLQVQQNFIQRAGNITAIGGAGAFSRGINVVGNYSLTAGMLTATGGSGADSNGVQVGQTLTQTGGSIVATAGSGANSYGLRTNAFVQSAGSILATGGTSTRTFGLVTNALTQNGTGLINAFGNSADSSHGIFVNGTVTQGGNAVMNATGGSFAVSTGVAGVFASGFNQSGAAQLTATGGTAQNAYGVRVTGSMLQSTGTITGTAGSAQTSYGIYVRDDLQQTGAGTIRGFGSTHAAGIRVDGNVYQDGAGLIAATGGGGANVNAQGFFVATLLNQRGNGTITATGGTGTAAQGIFTNNFEQSGAGTITATGGSGTNAHGIMVSNGFLQSGTGTITATGGTGANTRGIHVSNTLTQNSGVLNAISTASNGIFATTFIQNGGSLVATATSTTAFVMGTGTQTGGSITVTGGSSTGAHGMTATTFLQNAPGGLLDVTGGSFTNVLGFSVTNLEQQAGTIRATGGTASNSHGLRLVTRYIQNGGLFEVTGGSIANTNGLYSSGSAFIQNAGTIRAQGGSDTQTYGIQLTGTMTQNGAGIIRSTGGSGLNALGVLVREFIQVANGQLYATSGANAFGMRVNDNLQQQGTGLIQAQAINFVGLDILKDLQQTGAGTFISTGGAGATAYGTQVTQNVVQSGAGSITATGGTGANAFGIRVVQDITQSNAGNITATAGSGANAHGIQAGQLFTQSGAGTITATGANTAHGINVVQNFTQNGTGTITATGGVTGRGINVGLDFTQSGAGSITATGGSGTNAHGINVAQNLIQNDAGTITATGSATSDGDGIWVALDTTQSAGTMNVTGGAAANAYGIYTFQDFNQSGTGVVAARAGAGADAYGLRADRNFIQTGGSSTAIASNALNGYGVYVHETANINGTLTVTPNMGGAVNNPAFYVNNISNAATGLTFGANSRLNLVLDGNTQRSGLVQLGTADVSITPGAEVGINYIHNMHSLPLNQPITVLFLENADAAGAILNNFQFTNIHPTLDWTITKTGNDYYLTVTRLKDTITIIPPNGNTDAHLLVNAKNLINAFPNLAGISTAESAPLRFYADIFENSLTAAEAKSNARFLQHNLTPHAFTRVPRLAVQDTVFVRNSMHSNLNSLKPQSTRLFACYDPPATGNNLVDNTAETSNYQGSANRDMTFYREQDDLGWQLWIDSYGQVGQIKPRTEEYNRATQQTVGMAIGARHVFESGNSLAIAGHYLNGLVKTGSGHWGGKTDIRTQSAGASVGLRVLLPEVEIADTGFAPRLELMATYSALNIDQQRQVFNNRLDSDTNGDLYQGHVMLYTPFAVGEKTLVTPEAGITYSLVNIEGFKEQNHNNLGLTTDPQDYNSLLVHLGIKAETAATASVSLYGGISISKDLLEEQVKLDNRFRSVDPVRFQTVGEEDTGITAHLRTGINVRMWEDAYINAEYTFGASQGNQNHSIGFNFSIGF